VAKKIYHIPLDRLREFIKYHKSDLQKFYENKKDFEYFKLFGKSYYMLLIEEYLDEFQIQKDILLALKEIEYFNSKFFIKEIFTLLNFEQFTKNVDKDFLYAFVFYTIKKDSEFLKEFFFKVFIHYGSITKNSNISINYKDIVLYIAKTKDITIKESFGEDTKEAFFTLIVDNKRYNYKGKSIKTLRKKAYKELIDKI